MEHPIPIRLLNTLYALARLGLAASPSLVARCLELSPCVVESELQRLDDRRLVDAATCRLTLQGFAMTHAHFMADDSARALITLAA